MRTVQLRRYSITRGELDAFAAWWAATMPALRERAGFTVDFAYAIAERSEFVWAVSVPGARDRFEQLEREWIASPERAAAFIGLVERVERQVIAFAEDVLPTSPPAPPRKVDR
ncbi:hypothetical protein AB4Y63_09280 [Leifsonia sp. YAF41]|uniref:hypothetical protein n=1 Tax=Leifsonia sp. YAF41 TaxID=3233086 RepID=UPI003F9875A3